MNRLIIYICMVVLSSYIEPIYAKTAEVQDNYIHLVADRAPVLEQGGSAFKDWVQREIYAPYVEMRSDKTGELLVSFVVERNGEISSIEILSSPSREFSQIVRDAMLKIPTFEPAVNGGREVRFSLSYIMSFIADMDSVNIITGADDPFATNRENSLLESHGFTFNTEQDSTYLEFNQLVNDVIFNDKSNVESVVLVKSVEVRDFDANKEEDRVLQPETTTTSTRQPRTESGAPYVEYIDWIFSNIEPSRRSVLNKNSTVDGQITLSVIHEMDGSISNMNIVNSSDERLSYNLIELFTSPAKSSPALQGDIAVRYRSCISFSFKRLRELGSVSFSNEVHVAIAEDKPIGVEYVDELPLYNGEHSDAFFSRLSELGYEMLPEELRSLSSAVNLRVTIGKDGAVLSSEFYDSDDERFVAVVQRAISQMPHAWSAARVYGSSVGSIVSGSVIFSPKQRLR